MKMYFKVFQAALVLVFFSAPAVAQSFLSDFETPMPPVEALSQSQFIENTTLYEESRYEDSALAYNIRLPKDWSKSQDLSDTHLKLTQNVAIDLARYFGPPAIDQDRQKLLVQAIGLPHQMSAQIWLIQYLRANKYSLLGFEVEDEHRAEALYVVIEDKVSYVVRSVVQINGSKALFAQYFVPLERWHDYKKMQAEALRSFVLQQEVIALAEEMTVYPFMDVALVHYPVSWAIRFPMIESVDRLRAQMLRVLETEDIYARKTRTLEGQIEIEFVSTVISDDLETEVAKYDEILAEQGLAIGVPIDTEQTMIFNDFIEFAYTEVYETKDKGNSLIDYEFWITTLGTGDHYIFISLLTPARDTDFTSWIRNTETYKVVAQNIEPQNQDQ